MSMSIKVIGKDVMNVDGSGFIAITLAVFDGTTKVNNAVFVETESLAEALVGITEYGLLIGNSSDSDTTATVYVTAYVDEEEVSVECTVADIFDTAVGDTLGS